MAELSQDSRLATPDQWTVIERDTYERQAEHHRWRVVNVRNRRGDIRPGLECVICSRVEVLTDRQLRGNGRRIERAK